MLKEKCVMRLLFILTLAISSCTPQKRLNRLLNKFPELMNSKQDTIYIQSVEADTIFYYNQKDTVVIREGKLTMKYFYNNTDSTIFLQGKCDADTLIREIMIPSKVEYRDYWYNKVAYVLSGLFFLLLIMILIKLK